jgi:hypothetical protein
VPVILTTWEVEIGKTTVPGQTSKKFTRPHFNQQSWVLWHVPVIPATWGSTKRRTVVQASQAIKRDPISKITNGWYSGLSSRVPD